jgi:AcrR family transcriptional regulator
MAPLDEQIHKPLTKAGVKREATKAALIEAFEAIVAEDGIGAVGVNAVAKRAGVGKPLIYKYFGGFDGLVQAWAAQSKVWGSDEDIFSVLADNKEADPAQVFRAYMTRSATELRSKPIALQVMAQALLGPGDLTAGLEAAKQDSGKHHDALYQEGGVFDDPDTSALLLVMYAASQYLAMRSLAQSNFNGIALDTEDGWQAAMGMLTRVFDNAVAGAAKSAPRLAETE